METIGNWMAGAGLEIIVVGLAWISHGTGVMHLAVADFMSELSVWTINGSLVLAFALIVLTGSWKLLRDQPHSAGLGDDHFLGEP